jgi:hypothetical protein
MIGATRPFARRAASSKHRIISWKVFVRDNAVSGVRPVTTGEPMRTHHFGRKIKLPSTIAIKHQLRKLMAEDARKKAGAEAIETPAGEHLSQVGVQEKAA